MDALQGFQCQAVVRRREASQRLQGTRRWHSDELRDPRLRWDEIVIHLRQEGAVPDQDQLLTLHLDVSQGVAQTVVLRRSALPTAGADALLPGLLPSL